MIMLLWLTCIDWHWVACIAYFVTCHILWRKCLITEWHYTLARWNIWCAWKVLVLVLKKSFFATLSVVANRLSSFHLDLRPLGACFWFLASRLTQLINIHDVRACVEKDKQLQQLQFDTASFKHNLKTWWSLRRLIFIFSCRPTTRFD